MIHASFMKRAAETPKAPAIIFEDETMDYATLMKRARQVAAALRILDVSPGDRVLVGTEAGPDQIAAVIGTLLAGGVYVPIDATQPALRLRKIVAQCEPAAVLLGAPSQPDWADGCPCIAVDENLPPESEMPPVQIAGSDLAYIIFTSGTTGAPKGVAITHSAAWNTIADVNSRWKVVDSDRVLALSAITFDLSVYDIFGVLGAGGALVIPGPGKSREPSEWTRLLKDHAVTIWNSVPALMSMMIAYTGEKSILAQTALRLVILSGDWIPLSMPDQIRSTFAPEHLVSMGGATEASIWSIFFEIGDVASNWRSIPYGKALSNQSIYVLDADLNPCAVGEDGEICIGGVGLAHEYWREAERTAAAFVDGGDLGRLYKTGDRGVLLESGDVEFLGRRDTQVKIGGYRIELSDVEAAFLAHPGISSAVVKAMGSPAEPHGPFLVAFYIPKIEALNTAQLNAFLAERLPAYMVPTRVETLDAMPLTANGKIDRNALTLNESDAAVSGVGDALSRLIAECLSRTSVGEEENFFDLSAQSLTLARMIARIRDTFGIEIALAEIFANPSIAQLRLLIAEEDRQKDQLGRVSDHAPSAQASHNQQQVCFLASYFPLNRAYNFQATLRVKGDFDIQRLERAIDGVIARHELLRTTIHLEGEGYCSKVHPPQPFNIKRHDLTDIGADEQEAVLAEILSDTLDNTVFDVEMLPLLDIIAVRLAEDEWILIQIEHHVVHDGWSIGKLWAEVQELYKADLEGREPLLAVLPVQYQNYVAWQTALFDGEYGRKALDFIRSTLSGAAFNTRISPMPIDSTEMIGNNVRQEISAETYALVGKRSRELGISNYALMSSVFALYVAEQSGVEDFCIGAAASARTHREIEPLIGMIVNTVPVRARVNGARNLADLAGRMHAAQLDALRYQDIPLSMIVKELSLVQTEGRNPVFQYCFSFHDSAMPDFDFGSAQGYLHEEQNQTAKFDINVIVIPPGPTRQNDHARVLWEFSSRWFTAKDAERFSSHYAILLQKLLADPRTDIAVEPLYLTKAAVDGGAAAAMPSMSEASSREVSPHIETLCMLFRQVLERPEFGPDENIFESGCHSLSAIRVSAMFRKKTGLSLSVRTIFENPTVRSMCDTLQPPTGPSLPATQATSEAPTHLKS